MKKIPQCWLALSLLMIVPLVVGAQQPPEHINAYVFGVRAEQAEAAGLLSEALDHYKESLRLYQETARLHPDWNATVVQYRITTTANQMERVKRSQEAELKKKQEEAEAALREQQEKVLTDARAVWLAEKTTLGNRLAEFEADRVLLQEAMKGLENDLKQSRELITEMEKTVTAREKRIKKLEEGRDEAKAQADALRVEIADKGRQVALLQEQIANLPPPLITPEELDALRNERAARITEIAGMQARLSALQSEGDTLSNQLIQAEADKNSAIAKRDEDVQRLEQAAAALREQIVARDQEVTALQQQLANQPPPLILPEELEALRNELSARTANLALLQARITELEAQLGSESAVRLQLVADHAAALEKLNSGHEKEMASQQKKLAKLETTKADAKEKEEQLERTISDQKAEIKQLNKLQEEVDRLTQLLAAQPEPGKHDEELEALRNQVAGHAEEVRVLKSNIEVLQQDAVIQREIQQAVEQELANAKQALEAARNDLTKYGDVAAMSASFEKTEVENIVFKDTIQALSNRIESLSLQATGATDALAKEKETWNAERTELLDRQSALKETIDLNQQELEKVRELRAEIRTLEKENRKLLKNAKSTPDEGGTGE